MRRKPDATPRQKVIPEILSGIERVRIDTETNLLDVLDKVHEISEKDIDPTHVFALSQVYEGLLLKMGKKAPRRAVLPPRNKWARWSAFLPPGSASVSMTPAAAPAALRQVAGYMVRKVDAVESSPRASAHPAAREIIKHQTFYGREKENLIYPIGLANLILHGMDDTHIWHGNTLTGNEVYGGLFQVAPALYKVILTNPP